MFRAVWSKTLRDYRIPILSWGIGLGLLLYVVLAVYGTQINDKETLGQLMQSFRFFGDPVAIDTAEGYTTWRVLDLTVPLLLSIWTLLEGAQFVRGYEERNAADLLFSVPLSRLRFAVEKLFALIIALLLIGLLIGLGGILGEASAKIDINAGRAILAGLNVSLVAFFFAAGAFFLSQLLSRGAAAGITGALFALSFLLDGSGRILENGEWLQRFSPLYYYGLNKPLIPIQSANLGAAALLLGGAILLIIASTVLFTKRDIGGFALPAWQFNAARISEYTDGRALRRAWRSVFNRTIGLRALRAQAVGMFWWLLSIAAYAAWTTSLTPSMLEPLRKIVGDNPGLEKIVSGRDIVTNASLMAFIVFQYAIILAVVFALTQAIRWPSDLDRGRMELILSTPQSRARVALERFGATFIMILLAPLVIFVTVIICAGIANISVDIGNVAAASFSILPLELIVASAVYALAERVRAGVILGFVGIYLVAAFLIELFRSLLNLPDWMMALSIFHNYGSPLTEGMQWQPFIAMLAITCLLVIVGTLQFSQSNIDRGA